MADRFTARDKMNCALREVGRRRFIYPGHIAAGDLIPAGKMRQRDADMEIAMMDEIAADYAALAKKKETGREHG